MGGRMFKKLLLFVSLISFGYLKAGRAVSDRVVIISIDGGKPQALKKAKMPVLDGLIESGAFTDKAKTIFPSKTLPSHTSMLTGVGPDTHKITWNNWEPWRGLVQVPTVFSMAKKSGLSTALFATKDKFNHLEVPNSLDKYWLEEKKAKSAAKAAVEYLEKNKPQLLVIHFPDADIAGHSFGWESWAQLKALEDVDEAIEIVKKSLEKNFRDETYNLIITADHGGMGLTHGSNEDHDMLIPWLVWGTNVKSGHKITSEVVTMDTTVTTLSILGLPKQEGLEGRVVEEAFTP